MQTHQIKPIHKRKNRKRIGRGGKRGTFCGRGDKGQKSRAGAKFQPLIRQIIKRYPKKRGYRHSTASEKPAVVNVGLINNKFEKEDTITPRALLEKELIRRIKGKMPQVKILGKGKIEKSFIIENCQISKSAKEKIEKAKGKLKTKN